MMKSFFLLCGVLLMAASCTYDNIEETYQDYLTDCDTTVVSYAQDVSPILDQNCVTCHGPIAPQAGLDISTYEKVFTHRNKIKDRINRPLGDPKVMPQSGPMVPCNISKVNAWINQGAPNN